MNNFTFVHAADLHLDSPFQGIKEVSIDVARELQKATFRALERIVDICLEEKAAFLVLAGDLFDHSNYSLRAWLFLKEQLVRLAKQKITTFVAWGNHDHVNGAQVEISWPETVYFFPPGEVAAFSVFSKGREITRVHGISYPRAQVTENYAEKFKSSDSLFNIGVLHCNVGESPVHGNYAPCRLEDLINRNFDYWALGHIHTRGILNREYPTVVYPGNTQGRTPRETGEKGCFLVRVKSGQVADLEFKSTDTVRWQMEEVSIDGVNTEQEMLDILCKHLELLEDREPDISKLVRFYISGRGKLHRLLQEENLVEDLLEELRKDFGKKKPFIWVESINVRTKPEFQLSSILGQDNLPSDFYHMASEMQQNFNDLSMIKEALTPLFKHRKLRHFLNLPSDTELMNWLEDAVWMGLELLMEEED